MKAYGFSAPEIFQMAVEIEKNGRLFYERAEKMATMESPFKRLLCVILIFSPFRLI